MQRYLSLLVLVALALALALAACPGSAPPGPGPVDRTKRALEKTKPPADPLVHVQTRYPEQRYVTARGRGANAEAARASAKQHLLERIQSKLKGVKVGPASCEGEGCAEEMGRVSGKLAGDSPSFKHGALIEVVPPLQAAGGDWVTLAILQRSKAASFLEKEVERAREKLEAWRKQMREGLGAKEGPTVMKLCAEDPGPLLADVERARLQLAVIARDADTYTPSDDLKSVLELQIRARSLLQGASTALVLTAEGGDAKVAKKLASEIKALAVGHGLEVRQAAKAPTEAGSLVMLLTPEIEWSHDSFHFLRVGFELEMRFAGAEEAFLQYNLEGNRTKGGGVKEKHARRESFKKLEKIVAEELKPQLPSLSCAMSW